MSTPPPTPNPRVTHGALRAPTAEEQKRWLDILASRPLASRLSDEADLCRNEGADDIANLLDDAAGTIVHMSWQPIETAPRYAEVLVYCPQGERMKLFVAENVGDEWEDVIGRSIEKVGGYPTHWMPLPEPPSSAPHAPDA